ncbi:MAG: hypothetical protein KKC71_02130, partial [Chloroflexi bacterium]|nr:hypothetical protein [Chloroflexota bacterium]
WGTLNQRRRMKPCDALLRGNAQIRLRILTNQRSTTPLKMKPLQLQQVADEMCENRAAAQHCMQPTRLRAAKSAALRRAADACR